MSADNSASNSWKPATKQMKIATEKALEKGFMPTGNFLFKTDEWVLRCMDCNELTKTTYSKFIRNSNFQCQMCKNKDNQLHINLENILLNDKPITDMLIAKLKPLEPYSGNSANKWKCECMQCGAICFPRYYDVSKKNKGGCKACGSKVDNQFVRDAIKIMLEAELEPIEEYKTADSKWRCKCLKCGNEVSPRFNNVRRGHGGCVYCQVAAFKPAKPAYFYFIHNKEFASFKVGVGNTDNVNDRLKSHTKAGWTILEKINYDSGKKALKMEKAVINWLRKEKGIPQHLTNEFFSHAGATETFSDESVEIFEVREKIYSLHKHFFG